MNGRYLNLMERILSAYSDRHIEDYFEKAKAEGLKEHGFPRLTANIGILIANGRRLDLLPLFKEMMDFCCKSIPRVKAANDFSVREIVLCIHEIEKSGAVEKDVTEQWRAQLKTIEPESCYTKYAKTVDDYVRNWALFTGVSEFYRQRAGLCDTTDFIETQIGSQLKWLDENGMYMDSAISKIHQPIVYDLVPRGLFMLLIHGGYRGKYYEDITAALEKSEKLTLSMQSVTGELAFGGRSNQFLHNESWLAAAFEYTAAKYKKAGNIHLAKKYKAAADLALSALERELEKEPITHIKNRFPTSSFYGCENYAYFDKYMITAASNLYASSMFCDDTIEPAEADTSPMIAQTSRYFHKIFMRAGGYYLEFDTSGDAHYDASGLGRVHKLGAPSEICMSVPCPKYPGYKVDIDEPKALSLAVGIKNGGEWTFATDEDSVYKVLNTNTSGDSALLTLATTFSGGKTVEATYFVDECGVSIELSGKGDIAFLLPAFHFDGEGYTAVHSGDGVLEVSYKGYTCRYTAGGEVHECDGLAANRNGHYRRFFTSGKDHLNIKIEIFKQ